MLHHLIEDITQKDISQPVPTFEYVNRIQLSSTDYSKFILRILWRPVARSITEKESQKAELEADLMGAKDLKKTKAPLAALGHTLEERTERDRFSTIVREIIGTSGDVPKCIVALFLLITFSISDLP